MICLFLLLIVLLIGGYLKYYIDNFIKEINYSLRMRKTSEEILDNRIKNLKARISALEEYLKIDFIREQKIKSKYVKRYGKKQS